MRFPSRRIHLTSFLTGLALAAVPLVLTSLGTVTPVVKTLRINLDPEPAAIVRIVEGEVYKVPEKHSLVLKALGGGGSVGGPRLLINGALVVDGGSDPDLHYQALAFPVIAHEGDVVTVEEEFPDPFSLALATGYLAP